MFFWDHQSLLMNFVVSSLILKSARVVFTEQALSRWENSFKQPHRVESTWNFSTRFYLFKSTGGLDIPKTPGVGMKMC